MSTATTLERLRSALTCPSGKEHTIAFRKDGYKERTYQVSRSVGIGWVILDILGGLAPLIVDAATGDWFMLDTDHVNVIMAEDS